MELSAAARAGYGALLLTRPGVVLGIGGRPSPGWTPTIVQLLGARHLMQAVVLTAYPELGRLGAVVDLLHALTDLGAAVDRRLRAPALFDATIAGFLAAGGVGTP